MKKTMITLQSGEIKQQFNFEHAENILKSVTNTRPGGTKVWELTADSKYEFMDNELRTKPNNRKAGKA